MISSNIPFNFQRLGIGAPAFLFRIPRVPFHICSLCLKWSSCAPAVSSQPEDHLSAMHRRHRTDQSTRSFCEVSLLSSTTIACAEGSRAPDAYECIALLEKFTSGSFWIRGIYDGCSETSTKQALSSDGKAFIVIIFCIQHPRNCATLGAITSCTIIYVEEYR
ncbi:hypothetical protein M422DRAFT_263635 [Sphaerobolus stellatus SS14]|uniref:Uncharacterized protein n=1 Tax=Sphaerobolus stellatus (strain SS14) TaxID=990650 RepID=A0A0C9UYF1_SPHS4|nr:hypothetical protein M422DRAFT_263635 [Sphaerobolus stellatus SS14]